MIDKPHQSVVIGFDSSLDVVLCHNTIFILQSLTSNKTTKTYTGKKKKK
jgi:hypothetical protein